MPPPPPPPPGPLLSMDAGEELVLLATPPDAMLDLLSSPESAPSLDGGVAPSPLLAPLGDPLLGFDMAYDELPEVTDLERLLGLPVAPVSVPPLELPSGLLLDTDATLSPSPSPPAPVPARRTAKRELEDDGSSSDDREQPPAKRRSRSRKAGASGAAGTPSAAGGSSAGSVADGDETLLRTNEELQAMIVRIDEQLRRKDLDPATELALKKQRRQIKNRESASLSRQRKKQFIGSLESQVTDLKTQLQAKDDLIRALQAENEALRDQLRVRGGSSGSDTASTAPSSPYSALGVAGTTLMVCLLCFGLFMAPPSGAPLADRAPSAAGGAGAAPMSYGRSLKSVALLDSAPAPRAPALSSPSSAHSTSSLATRPARVAKGRQQPTPSEISAWLAAHHKRLLSQMNSTNATTLEAVAVNATEAQRRGGAAADTNTALIYQAPLTSSTDDLTFDASPVLRLATGDRSGLFRTVTRRTDTSYIFCTEVQVAAATDGDKRMSLIIPTPQRPAHGSALAPTLLQIDCDVVNTRVLDPEPNSTVGPAE